MQLAMSEQEVLDLCAREKIAVSTIEPLPAGGIRLVCSSVRGAEAVREKAKSKIVRVEQLRAKHRPASPLW